MKIEFNSDHKSIEKFDTLDLPDFTIFTGINGSGKTQLLKALQEGKVKADSIKHADIIYFDYVDFTINNEQEYQQQVVENEIHNGWNNFIKSSNQGRGTLIIGQNEVMSKKTRFLQESECKELKNIAEQKNKPLWYLNDQDISNVDLQSKFQNYKNQISDLFNNPNAVKYQPNKDLMILLKKITCFLDEITESEFREMYNPVILKNNFLPMQIGKTFLSYRIKEYEESNRQIENNLDVIPRTSISVAVEKVLKRQEGLYHGNF